MTLERFAGNRLALNDLEAADMEETPEGREVLEYVAKCALASGDVLVATDRRGTEYEFPGLLGLAKAWETRPLTPDLEQVISACLVAHVNAFGFSVTISARADGRLEATEREKADYPVYEGSFFGDVFARGGNLRIYACQGDDGDIARLFASSRSQRVCTDPGLGCEVTAVGRCRDVCATHTDKYGWRQCTVPTAGGGTEYYEETVSTFLFADTTVQQCGAGKRCEYMTPSDQPALLDCAGASCAITCGSGGTCLVDGAGATHLSVTVESDSAAQVDCLDAASCTMTCGNNASCELDCKDADSCSTDCQDRADCLLDCTGVAPEACRFSDCPGGTTTCPGDIIVCGRACP